MLNFARTFIIFCLVCNPILAAKIETFYGVVDVEEPVLLDLIESSAFQRLKHIHQYGVAYYTTHREEFTRYDHSLGVFFLLRLNSRSLEEQIAGLLHDVSHTVFSHVGDWVFNQHNEEMDYQTLTHADYLERSGLSDILCKHGYTVEKILPKQELFPALEQPLPALCADRLDYNLQGAFYQGFMTHEETIRLFHEIKFIDGKWMSKGLLKKLVRFSIFMSQNCWGSPTESVLSIWLADAMMRGVSIGIISMEEIRFGIDQEIWERLMTSYDPLIQKNMHMILHSSAYHSLVSKEEANLFVVNKFRGIDPLIEIDGEQVRLTQTDPVLAEEFQKAKERMSRGWPVKVSTSLTATLHFQCTLFDSKLSIL